MDWVSSLYIRYLKNVGSDTKWSLLECWKGNKQVGGYLWEHLEFVKIQRLTAVIGSFGAYWLDKYGQRLTNLCVCAILMGKVECKC